MGAIFSKVISNWIAPFIKFNWYILNRWIIWSISLFETIELNFFLKIPTLLLLHGIHFLGFGMLFLRAAPILAGCWVFYSIAGPWMLCIDGEMPIIILGGSNRTSLLVRWCRTFAAVWLKSFKGCQIGVSLSCIIGIFSRGASATCYTW